MNMRSEGRERAPVFVEPSGFTCNTTLADKTSIADYEAAGMAVPKPGEYVINNGVIAVATSEGKVAVWVPRIDEQGNATEELNEKRTVSFDKAMEQLKEMGYEEGSWGVPRIL